MNKRKFQRGGIVSPEAFRRASVMTPHCIYECPSVVKLILKRLRIDEPGIGI